jgi:hypothetical protein
VWLVWGPDSTVHSCTVLHSAPVQIYIACLLTRTVLHLRNLTRIRVRVAQPFESRIRIAVPNLVSWLCKIISPDSLWACFSRRRAFMRRLVFLYTGEKISWVTNMHEVNRHGLKTEAWLCKLRDIHRADRGSILLQKPL